MREWLLVVVGDLVVGRMSWVTGEWPVFLTSFHLFLFHKISVLFGLVSTELQSHLVSECLFSLLSSLPLPFLLGFSVLSFPVQTGLWSSCPKPFIWTVYRVNMLSWFVRPLVAGASREQARRERPVARMGCWAQDSTSLESGWQGCKYTAGTHHPCHTQFL